MNENGTNKGNGRFAVIGLQIGVVAAVVYISLLPLTNSIEFIILMTTGALPIALISLRFGIKGHKLGERRLWVYLNLAVSVGFLIVLGILGLNIIVAYSRIG